MLSQRFVLLTFGVIAQLLTSVIAEDEHLNITITCPDYQGTSSCPEVKVINEFRLELKCTVDDNFVVHWFKWIHSNGSDINELVSPRMRYTTANQSSTLTIDKVVMEDFGNFTCETSNEVLNTYTFVNVYIVPDYFVAGIVLLSVNMALCILFVACLIRSVTRQKSMKKHLVIDQYEVEKLSNKS